MIGRWFTRILTSLSSSDVPLWQELWEYLEDKYFSVDLGRYENINMGSSSLINLRNVILGICIGIIIAAGFIAYDKNKLGSLVRKLIHEECLWPEKAKTLGELGFQKSPGIRGSLKKGVLSKVVKCVERDEHERATARIREAYIAKNGSDEGFESPLFIPDFATAHFYIPDEEHYKAEIRFEEKGSGWRAFLLVLIVTVVLAILVCFLLPDMLQLVDNMIGILKGDGNVVN